MFPATVLLMAVGINDSWLKVLTLSCSLVIACGSDLDGRSRKDGLISAVKITYGLASPAAVDYWRFNGRMPLEKDYPT